ncbi:hypothetical protein HOLleu_26103 [Holothuria leucospilota]|uniref:Uncharacterized protein n=1 Tax=Holothuria leucospilota TaxID=206669 RepID=A0A9Q1H500_HOLLE|nr:hypothetical protein HOLleu_26103 [Holothuria leucospilota]
MSRYIDEGETYHLFDDNLTKIERLLDEGVNIAKQLGIQSVKWNGLTLSIEDFLQRAKAGYLFKPSKEEIKQFLQDEVSFHRFRKKWYQSRIASMKAENDKLRERENNSILRGSQIRSQIREYKKGAFISDRSLSGLNQTLTRLQLEQAQLQEALRAERQSKEAIKHDLDCLEELCQELHEKNVEFVKESQRLENIDRTFKQNEELNKLTLQSKLKSLTRKIQRISTSDD